jgi:hypothetical protein
VLVPGVRVPDGAGVLGLGEGIAVAELVDEGEVGLGDVVCGVDVGPNDDEGVRELEDVN